MAGNAESRPARRLSVRAATEPLPAPLPPPPHPARAVQAPGNDPGGLRLHSVPPQPHFVTRFPRVDQSQFEPTTTPEPEPARFSDERSGEPEPLVPERSLASPGVIMALAASIAVLCAIGWYEKHGVEGFQWDAIKTFVQRWSIDPADPDEDLPFITAVPLTPNPGGAASIAKLDKSSAKKADQVVLSDVLKDEAPGNPDDDRTQRR